MEGRRWYGGNGMVNGRGNGNWGNGNGNGSGNGKGMTSNKLQFLK